MKIQHSNLDEPELISVYVGTWNMGKGPGEGGLVEAAMARCEPGWVLGGVPGNLRSELVVSGRRRLEKTPTSLLWALSVLS